MPAPLTLLPRIALATLAVASAGLATATDADASTPASVCGSGFYEIDHQDIQGATVYLEYNNGTDCVVTWKTSYVGTPSPTEAVIANGTETTTITDPTAAQRQTSDWPQYSYYAGPVKLYAPHECIVWGGLALPPNPGAGGYGPWLSKPDHCG